MVRTKTTVWTGLNYAAVQPGLPIGVIGIGGLGMYALQFAAGLGHPTIAIDNRQEGLDLAGSLPSQFQPTAIIDSNAPDAQNQVLQAAGGGGLAGVLVCTDNVSVTEWILKPLCIPLGLPPDGFKFSAFDVVFKELTIRGSLVANRRLVSDMMRFVAEKGVRAHVSTVRLDDAEDLPQRYSDPHLKGRLVVVM
ncbi:alcohol dehydrogenase GroES-like domain-containing protein [Aspergillus affinis]|uniref:alcohol dehydrogenase GroES-like domain-containing protein n=1 Tax=Aspergillus affinis TaxID=1070780 RepID=UPI0022FE87A3|nr:alcohol dehydrogenase GroES-like domain-containing protein [Aspergillus affinis]KAI9035091.1 alcohol dehydrogenase GroES-like domain-containing protein [Aspergillus affinis]